MVLAGTMINRWLPAWPVQANLTSNPWMLFQVDLVRSALAVLPPAIAWGGDLSARPRVPRPAGR